MFEEEGQPYLEEYESIVHIPMSSGLSGSCQTAAALAQEFGGRVQVVYNQRISVSQKHSVADPGSLRLDVAVTRVFHD